MFPNFAGLPPGLGLPGGAAPAAPAPLVRFKAGKMTAEWQSASRKFLVSPQNEKGEIVLTRAADGQLLHFQWLNRVSKEVVDDYIVFADCEYKKVDTGREDDRVYMLEWTGSSRRFFFWMQDKDDSKDAENMAKINEHISSPGEGGGAAAGAGAGAGDAAGEGLDWNAFSNVLSQNAGTGANAGAGAGNTAGASGGGAAQPRLQLEQLQNVLSQMDIPATATPTDADASANAAADGGGAAAGAGGAEGAAGKP